jgi:hypothetical protein
MKTSVSAPLRSRASLHAATHSSWRYALPILAAAFAVTAAAEPALHVLKGSSQQTTYAAPFAARLTVWVNDSVTQQSLSGVRVLFAADSGIGLSEGSAVTDEHGLASVSATGLAPGSFTANAQVQGLPATQVRFLNLVVNKAILTVVPADIATRTGDKVPPITAYTIHGFVNGDTEESAQISGSPVLTTTAKDSSPHANYAIKGGVGTLSSPNYTFVAGFGTLAVAGPADAATDEPVLNTDAEPSSTADAASVRPALMNKAAATALREPAFLAGLRGESGIFVQTAISAAPAVKHTADLTAQVRIAALPKPSSSASSVTAAPVREAVAPKPVTAPARFSTTPAKTAVALNASAAAANATSSYAGLSIRTALIVPGAKVTGSK